MIASQADERSSSTRLLYCPAGLRQLEVLELREIAGPDDTKDVIHLTKLTGLKELRISGALGVTNASATAIARSLTRLKGLELSACYITRGSVLQEIAKLPLLEALNISEQNEGHRDGRRLSDKDIKVLLPIRHLNYLVADGTFSEKAIQTFYDYEF
jgi:hypothetical protein